MVNNYVKRFKITELNNYILGSKYSNKISRFGVQHIINTYVKKAKEKYPNYFKKKITNHSFRQSKAMHSLEAGVNLIYIRDILGYESITTTEIYAKTNPEIKRKLLKKIVKVFMLKTDIVMILKMIC